MNVPTLSTLLSAFFLRYLAVERGVSPHTTTSYISASRNLVICWLKSTAWLSTENVITCSSPCYTTLARVSRNFLM